MKTILTIQILLVSFKLITAITQTIRFHDDINNASIKIEYEKLMNSSQQNVADIKMIKQFEKSISSRKEIKIPEEDAEFINKIKFKYWLNDSSSVDIEFGNESILKSRWKTNQPLKVIVHGWSYARPGEPKAFSIKDAYIHTQQYNIVTMDWSTIASSIHYFDVIRFSAQVGIILGNFLINLVRIDFVIPADIHVIGHSIGAHVAGKSGRIFLQEMNKKIDRITGLDPASPGFHNSWICTWIPEERLNKNDAIFVDVIHTETRIQGVLQPIGHVDFYPNNGNSHQPGCESFNVIEMLHCSHSRAYVFYSESINDPSSFVSSKFNSLKEFDDTKCIKEVINVMGHHANRNSHGLFYLKTENKSPFSKNLN